MIIDKIYFLNRRLPETESEIESFIDKAEDLWNIHTVEWLIQSLNNLTFNINDNIFYTYK